MQDATQPAPNVVDIATVTLEATIQHTTGPTPQAGAVPVLVAGNHRNRTTATTLGSAPPYRRRQIITRLTVSRDAPASVMRYANVIHARRYHHAARPVAFRDWDVVVPADNRPCGDFAAALDVIIRSR